MIDFIQHMDISVLNYMQQHLKCDFLDKIMPTITSLGNLSFIWIMAGIMLFSIKKYRKYGFMIFLSLIFCALIGNITLKPLVARIRPFDAYPLIDGLLIKAPHDYSFPSGHTMSSFAPVTVLLYFNKKIGLCALFIGSLIAFSRLYLYVHYPSDVLAGIVIGIVNGIIAIFVVEKTY